MCILLNSGSYLITVFPFAFCSCRTGAIRVGDKLLAINGVSTVSKTLTEATAMLQSGGELVTLKIARQDKQSR